MWTRLLCMVLPCCGGIELVAGLLRRLLRSTSNNILMSLHAWSLQQGHMCTVQCKTRHPLSASLCCSSSLAALTTWPWPPACSATTCTGEVHKPEAGSTAFWLGLC